MSERAHGGRNPPEFRPAPWLASPHLQTAVAALAHPEEVGAGEHIAVAVAGGRLVGRLHRAVGGRARTVVLLLHGAAGHADEAYLRRTASKATSAGLDAVRLCLRGASDGASPAVLHGGLTEDIHAAVAHFAEAYAGVALVGFSLGGQIALKTACEWGARPPGGVVAVVGVSPALDLGRSARFFDRPTAAPYRRVVMAALRGQYLRARETLPVGLRALDAAVFRSAAAYNQALVAPAFGFRDVADYYARASSIRDLGAIRVPALVLHAADDPLVPAAPLIEARSSLPAVLRAIVTERGGHVGFVAGAPAPGDPDRFWAECRAIEFIRAAAAT